MGGREHQHGSDVAIGGGDRRVRIAILDGPVDLTHPCFAGAWLTVLSTLADGPAGGDALAHGTHVASIVFGQKDSAVPGVAPACEGLIVPIFGAVRDGGPACSQLDLARAILAALEHGADIINVSSGQPAASGEAEPLLAQAIDRCRARNVLIVAAAGNDGCDCLHVPAAAGSVLAVGAMDGDGRPLASSNWGAAYRGQGVLAPGFGILGAVPGGGVARRSGTSYAAAHVAGLAALLVGLQLSFGRTADPHAVRQALLASAFPCPDDAGEACRRYLAGRVDFSGAATMIATNPGGTIMTTSFELPAAAEEAATAIFDVEAARPAPSWANGLRPSDGGEEGAATGGAGQVSPSDCGCGCGGTGKKPEGECGCGAAGGGKRPALVYALGKLGIDFGTEARRDSLLQAMSVTATATTEDDLTARLLGYFDEAPYDAPSVVWTLNLDATPIYAIQPTGPYCEAAYERLRAALRAQIAEGADLLSVPGIVTGRTRLQSGQVVPTIVPAVRGLFSWATKPLVLEVLGAAPKAASELESYNRQVAGLTNYLDRVYFDLRNLGLTGEERALNYSATNAVQITSVINSATRDALDLDRIAVRKSPICRPDSECYDVELSFFNPNNTNIANRVFRFTVDVSDIIPVTVGTVRSWTRRV